MKKRLLALIVSASMLACPSGAFAATGFSDLTEFHAWAEPQIEEMTTLGIIKGYTDGTFRPDQAITKAEAIVLTARVAGYTDEQYSAFTAPASGEYLNFVSAYQMKYPHEAAYLMYKHILSESDMASYLADGRSEYPLSRLEMAELIVKLLRAEDQLKQPSFVTLTYSDAADILYEAYPYVDYVTAHSIMNGVYDPEHPNDTFFKPNEPVTRAQMAVLLHRLLDKIKITVDYKTTIGRDGAKNTLTFMTDKGVSIYQIPENANLVIDGYYADNVGYAQASGAKVCFFYINGVLKDIEIVNDAANRFDGEFTDPGDLIPSGTVSGVITSITTSAGGASVGVGNEVYAVSSSAVVYVNNVVATVYDLRQGQTVSLLLTDGLATRITASDYSVTNPDVYSLTGTVTAVNSSKKTVSIQYVSSSGETLIKRFDVDTGASIVKNTTGKALSLDDVEEGDTIAVTGVLRSGNFNVSSIVIY